MHYIKKNLFLEMILYIMADPLSWPHKGFVLENYAI